MLGKYGHHTPSFLYIGWGTETKQKTENTVIKTKQILNTSRLRDQLRPVTGWWATIRQPSASHKGRHLQLDRNLLVVFFGGFL